MWLLLTVSFIWAFSFGLIKDQLSGLDSTAVAFLRLALALPVFLPFLWRTKIRPLMAARLAFIGAVQFGCMYLFYQRAFAYLNAYEVAVYTIFTPIYVVLFDSVLAGRFRLRYLLAALMAVGGAALIKWSPERGVELGVGFVLVQLSNICFAAGQLSYKRMRAKMPAVSGDAGLFGWLLAGAVLVTGLASLGMTEWASVTPTLKQWLVLLYLGVLASGGCFFWWNLGATRVNTGTLAVFNNVKIPAAVLCALLVFGESVDLGKLIGGMALMFAALWLAKDDG